jgi:hypothetical protein
MSESTRKGKRQPSWLTGEEPEATNGSGSNAGADAKTSVAEAPPRIAPGGGRKGPLAEGETGEMPHVQRVLAEEPSVAAPTETVPRVTAPGTGQRQRSQRKTGGNSPAEIFEHLRANPAPAAIALLVLLVLLVALPFLFFRGSEAGGERASAEGNSADRVVGAQRVSEDPFGGGPVRDSGVVFGAMQEDGEEATLDGAGLSWSGTVTRKEGEAGQTVTLEGPTAAQLERGFDLGSSDVETGVYAVAQDGGEVLHVTTQTFVPQEEGDGAETTLGTVYALEEGRLDGYAYYLDRREPGSDTVTRTYVRPDQESYRVSFEAPAAKAKDGDRNGTFVPLLVGWRGFEDRSTNGQEGG